MATKKPKAGPTDEELLAQFDDLGTESKQKTEPQTKQSAKPASTPSAAAGKPKQHPTKQSQEEADILAELDNLAQEKPKSRPHTPRNVPGSAGASERTSEEKAPGQAPARKSVDSTRSFHQAQTPVDNAGPELGQKVQDGVQAVRDQVFAGGSGPGGGAGWWGGLMATASAAVKQAEALAKDLRENEEAQKWAEQVRGNVGALRNYGERDTWNGL